MIRELSISHVLSVLHRDNLLPAIIFRTARKQCDEDVERLLANRRAEWSEYDRTTLEAEINEIALKFGESATVIRGHPQYAALVRCGVGAHHAGQLLVWRLLLEELMTRGRLRLLIATSTVAAGVDFPARTVVVTAHTRRNNDGFTTISSSELQQMAGRAGRRGRDTVGFCLVAPNRFLDARVLYEVSRRPPEPLRSAYFAAPSTVLNLLKYRNVDDLEYTVSRSLASFLDAREAVKLRQQAARENTLLGEQSGMRREKSEKRIRRLERQADDLEKRQLLLVRSSLSALEQLGFVARGGLTEKGSWAAELCTSLVLELAEAVADGLFDDLSTEEIVALVASIAADPHRNYLNIKANPMKKEYFAALEAILTRVRGVMATPSTSEIGVVPDAALTMLVWMESKSWYEFSALLRLAQVAEGDVSRLVSQTADHLNQLSRLTKTHPVLARQASEGRELILRPPLTEVVPVAVPEDAAGAS